MLSRCCGVLGRGAGLVAHGIPHVEQERGERRKNDGIARNRNPGFERVAPPGDSFFRGGRTPDMPGARQRQTLPARKKSEHAGGGEGKAEQFDLLDSATNKKAAVGFEEICGENETRDHCSRQTGDAASDQGDAHKDKPDAE